MAMASSPPFNLTPRWWLSNNKIVDKYIKEARSLISTHNLSDVNAALPLLDAALALSPRSETALELKARSLLSLRRFREVADMLQDYIPSYKMMSNLDDDDSSNSFGSAGHSSGKERTMLLSSKEDGDRAFRCFSVSDLRKKVMAGLNRGRNRQVQWRYLVLGQACCHLGLMEDAMVLLQTGRRIATAEFRRDCVSLSDDNFSLLNSVPAIQSNPSQPPPPPPPQTSESVSAAHLLTHIKLLLRRRTAAMAALDAGLPAEAIRHFSKILDGRRGTPHPFAVLCLIGRSSAYMAVGRVADSIADCNRALSLDPTSIATLRARADLMEYVRMLPDCLRDLDHLKLLYDSILRDRKLPGPAWKPHYDVRYRDIPSGRRTLMTRIQGLRMRVANGEGYNVDYYTLIGVRRGCSRSELERAHLLLSLKHKADKASGFVDKLEFGDDHRDLDSVRDQARMSALILYRMLQKGYSSIMSAVMEEEAEKRQKAKEEAAAAAAAAASAALQAVSAVVSALDNEKKKTPVYQGVFCRDLAAVGSLLSQSGFRSTIPVKYEALSC